MAQTLAKQNFFKQKNFAVVGASKDQKKYGTKVLQWYKARDLDVTPIHPVQAELEGIKTLKNVGELSAPTETSISIITPAVITLQILEKAKELSVPSIWLQPGAEDASVIDFINNNDLKDKVIYGGPCILIEGDSLRARSSL
ncbi:NAD(P)-binding protein [Marasmius fiardii PR-910]|nr:NAD(P)-binding protein [Marasmius fiardii PR-910]